MGNAADKKKLSLSDRWKAVKAQFKRIIWPTKEAIIKETCVVLGVSVCLGAVIAVLDKVLLRLIDLIITI